MIVDGVWIGENISVNPFDLPKADRKLIDGELSLYSEWTLPNDKMSWQVPSLFTEPVLIEVGGKAGGKATCIIANKTPILKW